MELSLVIALIGLVFGLISLFIGIWVAGRLAGKFRIATIFLIFAIIIFIIEMASEILNIFITSLEFIINIAHIGVILFITFAIINMKQMIDGIDNHYKKK